MRLFSVVLTFVTALVGTPNVEATVVVTAMINDASEAWEIVTPEMVWWREHFKYCVEDGTRKRFNKAIR
jgi:hypothetical protein